MLFSVAGLRLYVASIFTYLTFIPIALARDEILFTSSVSYCAPPELVLVQQFDVTYIAANASVFFNISAASVEKNVNVSANLLLNVYGMQPLNLTIDLCDLLNGLLCPLPTYNFVGSTTIPVPSSVNVANHVPGIAYKIPDLEAFAQLTLTSVDTGEVKACVQSTLSNGWSTRQAGVQWATGGLAFFSLLSALWHSIESPEALAPFRFIDMMSLFQTIAVSALLNLNYPVVYRSFASNFAWSLGLFSASATSKVQDAINNLRHLTGGTMPDANGGSAIDLVNRKLSPYNVNQRNTLDSLQGVVTSFMDNLKTAGNSNHLGKRDVALVTSESSNILQAGIPVFVNSLGISTANAFMSVFFTLLMLAAITLAVLLFGWAILILVLKRREKKACLPGQVEDWKLYYPWFSKAWAIRLALISFLPVSIFVFNQWTLKDSWLATLFSVITFLAILSAISYPTYRTICLVRRNRPWILYRTTPHIMSTGPLYIQYRHQRWFFYLVFLFAALTKAIITSFASASGLAQVIVLLITELTVLNITVLLKPHETRGGDFLACTLAVARVIATGMFFAFVEKFEVAAIPRVAVGIVIAVMFSLIVIFMLLNTFANLGLRDFWIDWQRWRIGTRIGSSTHGGSMKSSFSEKATGSLDTITRMTPAASQSNPGLDRPRNPTPLHNVPFDMEQAHRDAQTWTPSQASSFLSPLPSSLCSPTSFASSSGPDTARRNPRDTVDSGFVSSVSGSTTLGSVLPRRPSFEGLGLDRLSPDLDLESRGADSHSPATTNFISAPSTPLSHSHPSTRHENFRESCSLPPSGMPEDVEVSFGHDRE